MLNMLKCRAGEGTAPQPGGEAGTGNLEQHKGKTGNADIIYR